jgi:long-chain acyl-CoA synthetase
LEIIEFYGSTEASIIALTARGRWQPGIAGRVVADVEYKLTASDELMVKSPGVTPGYYVDGRIQSICDRDGFLATGDHARLVGRELRVLGRRRDTLNTSEGSNVYAEPLELAIERLPGVSQAIVLGHQRPYLTALIVPDRAINADAPGLEPSAAHDLYRVLGAGLARLNARVMRCEHIVRFLVLARPFSRDTYATIGPGKVRRDRRRASETYADQIARLYAADIRLGADATFVPGTDRRLRPRAASERPSSTASVPE